MDRPAPRRGSTPAAPVSTPLGRANRHHPLFGVVARDHPLAKLSRPVRRADLEERVQLVLFDPASRDGPNYGVVSTRVWRFVELSRRLDFLVAGLGWYRMPRPLGHQRPAGLVAAHVNLPFVFPDILPPQPAPDEAAAIAAAKLLVNDGFAYFQEQATGPQTIGYALADSPVGQAMWTYEKLARWSDSRQKPGDAFTLDQILDNVTLYWLTGSGASSARIYWEQSGHPARLPSTGSFNAGTIDLPMAGSVFPGEFYRAPRQWAKAHWPNLFYWNEVPRGGHFAAFEQPALFTQELRNAFRTIRHA